MKVIKDSKIIQALGEENEGINDRFILFLKSQTPDEIDCHVQDLSSIITPLIDCKECGNCCRSLMIQVDKQEITRLSLRFNISEGDFMNQYIENGIGDQMIMNSIPCRFLDKGICSIYEDRFSSCREFPALHLPKITSRLFIIFMHYGRCPIIFNVIEALKERLNFKSLDTCLADT